MIDRCTRWPEVIPIPDITVQTVAQNFFSHWIARFGCPVHIPTDQGRQFENALFSAFSKLLGIKRFRTSPYHPQVNGLIEEFHRPLKAVLKAYNTDQWCTALPTLLLGFRSVFKEDLGATTAELVYGRTLRLPGEFFQPSSTDVSPQQLVEDLKSHFETLRPVPTSCHGHGKIFVHPHLNKCSHVFVRHDGVRKPLQAPYDGPYKVLARKDKTFDLMIKGTKQTVSLDRLKPAFISMDSNTSPAMQTTRVGQSHLAKQTTSNIDAQPVPASSTTPVPVLRKTRTGRPVVPPRRYVHFE